MFSIKKAIIKLAIHIASPYLYVSVTGAKIHKSDDSPYALHFDGSKIHFGKSVTIDGGEAFVASTI